MRRVLVFVGWLVGLSCGSGDDDGAAPSTGSSGETLDPSSATMSDTSGTTVSADESSGDASTGADEPSPYLDAGPFGVGAQSITVPGRGRDVLVTLWYPTEVLGGSAPLSALVAPADAPTLDALVDDAPPACVRAQTSVTPDAPVAPGTFPIVMFSHCLSCIGASSSFVAERMASHGIVVAGVTHTDDTLFDQQQGIVAPLDGEWLQVRALDIRLAFDAVTTEGPVASVVDSERAGVFGHSYGAATTGKVLQDDDRFVTGVAMAAPVENPLLPGVSTADIAQPTMFILAVEDNSIQAIGNTFIRNNAAAMPGGSWLVELADAGHWSVSDICGLIDAFEPGCGEGTRQTDGEPFTYLDPATGRQLAATYVTAFFALHLLDDPSAAELLATSVDPAIVTVTRYE